MASLFQVTVVALVFAVVNGDHFSSYYVFYGSLFFACLRRSRSALAYEWATGVLLRAAGYRRRAVLVGTGKHIEAVAHALADGARTPIEVVGYISLTPRPENGLRSLGALEDLPLGARARSACDEVIIADPDFPEQRGGRAGRRVPPPRRPGAGRALDDGAPGPPRGVRPGPVACRCSSSSRRSSRASTTRSSGPSTSSARALLLIVLSPLLLLIALAIRLSSRGPVVYRSLRPGIGGEPFACLKFRTMHRDADQRQADLESLNEAVGRAVQDPRRPAADRRSAASCAASRSTSCRSCSTCCAARCRSSARARCPSATSTRLEDWHKKRYLVLPGITGLWQVSGRSELDFDDLVRLDFLYLERWSVSLDLTILLKTLPAVLTRRGAF